MVFSIRLPPVFYTVTAKLTRVMTHPKRHIPFVSLDIIDSMWNNHTLGAGEKIMIVHRKCLRAISFSFTIKIAYRLFFLHLS
jgi:hypothetical protein